MLEEARKLNIIQGNLCWVPGIGLTPGSSQQLCDHSVIRKPSQWVVPSFVEKKNEECSTPH